MLAAKIVRTGMKPLAPYCVVKIETVLSGFSIEIPRGERERILVFQLKNGTYRLVDDFLGPSEINDVRMQSGQIQYLNARKRVILSRPMSK